MLFEYRVALPLIATNTVITDWRLALNSDHLGSWADRNGAWVILLIFVLIAGGLLIDSLIAGDGSFDDLLFAMGFTLAFPAIAGLLCWVLKIGFYEALLLLAFLLMAVWIGGDLLLSIFGPENTDPGIPRPE